MSSPQYNPRRRQQRELPKKPNRRSGASPLRRGGGGVEIPAWLWMFIGTAIGIFASFLVHLARAPAAPGDEAAQKMAEEKSAEKVVKPVVEPKAAETPAAETASAKVSEDKGTTKPDETKTVTKFDFYTLLPEREVIVPNDREAMATRAAEKSKTAGGQQTNSSASESEQLFLQAGSFRSAQEAERRRGQIKNLGLNAKVEEVIANADTWYRVQAGPFTSNEQLSKARDQLKAAGVESLLLRQK